MNSITQNKRYCPHEIKTKVRSVKLYRETCEICTESLPRGRGKGAILSIYRY